MSINQFIKSKKGNCPVTKEYAEQLTNCIFNVFWDTTLLRKEKITLKSLQLSTNYGNKILNLDVLIAITDIVKIKKKRELFTVVGCMFSKFNKQDALLLAHLLVTKNNKFMKMYGSDQNTFLTNFCNRHVHEVINFHINNDYSLYHKIINPQLALACYDPNDIFMKYQNVYVQEKFDGERVIIKHFNKTFTYQTRTGIEMNKKKLEKLDIESHFTELNDFIVDGELVYIKNDEILPFNIKDKFNDDSITARCIIFDILQYGGTSCVRLPFTKRYELLQTFVQPHILADTIKVDDLDTLNSLIELKFKENKEGVIVRPDITYSENQRTIYKIKKLYTKYKVDVDLAVLGASYDVNNKLSILHCGMLVNDKLVFVTKVSSGLTRQQIDYFSRTLQCDYTLLTNEFVKSVQSQINRKMAGNPDVLFNGSIIIQVYGDSWSEDGSIRFPIFERIRDDKIYPSMF